jgi:hypothetical protein
VYETDLHILFSGFDLLLQIIISHLLLPTHVAEDTVASPLGIWNSKMKLLHAVWQTRPRLLVAAGKVEA